MTNTNRLPPALRENGLFCCWRYEERDGRRTKVPYNPRTGGRAQSTNPATFTPLAAAAAVQSRYDGLGVGIFGSLGAIDIDHCIDESGELSELAAEIVQIMDAYTESSPSGSGMRILFTVPEGFQYDKARYFINNQKDGLEVYIAGHTNKYVTVTGDAYTPGQDLEERGEQLRLVLEKFMRRPSRNSGSKPTPSSEGLVALDDLELVNRAKRSRQGAAFAALMDGDTSAYQSASEADLALCNMLAFWTGKDAARMDRIFRSSGLMREKWDRRQSGSTYGAITIQTAIDSARQTYEPQAHFRAKAAQLTTRTTGVRLTDLQPENNPRYGWNDIGNGNLFADWYKDVARYVPKRKKWFIYNGKVWKPDTGGYRAMELCKQLADALVIYALSLPEGSKKDEYRQFVERWQKRYSRETILKDAAGVYPAEMEEFDAEPMLYNCKNGTLDLRTLEFRPHSPADMLTMISGVKYDPLARSEQWERTVSEIMQGDTGRAAYLQKAMGYGLTGDTSEECFFLLYGPTTRNGKGTLMETYMRMQGDYGRTAGPETLAQRQKYQVNSRAPSEDIARLAGARVVNISEPDQALVLSAALVKALTGEDKIQARFLNENTFEFYPQFKLYINTNHLPQITDVSVFSSGRVKVIPFERHFTEKERDKGLKKRLAKAQEQSGILNWCLDGLRLTRETGFDPPPSVLTATAKYQQDSDKISRFIAEELEAGYDYEVRTAEAYVRYQEWCRRNGHWPPESSQKWKAKIERVARIEKKRPKDGGCTTQILLGYRLRPQIQPFI